MPVLAWLALLEGTRSITVAFMAGVEKSMPIMIQVQTCRHLRWKLMCRTCPSICVKNCTSTTAQISGHLVLLVKLASASFMLRKVPCHTPDISSNGEGSLEGVSLSLQKRVGGQHC